MSDLQKIQKIFRSYLTEKEISKDMAPKIIKIAYQIEQGSRSKQFLARLFDVMKKIFDGKNYNIFASACHRFFYIITKLLEQDTVKGKVKQYTELISRQIVQYYLFFFSIIFKNQNQLLLNLFGMLKMQRMKLIRLISDNSFKKIKQEIQKVHKCNIDKGFSPQDLQKIKKNHAKRGISLKQTEVYLGLSAKSAEKQQVQIKKEILSSSESQNSQYDSPYKRIKPNENTYSTQISNYSQSNYQGYSYGNPNNVQAYSNSLNGSTPRLYDPRQNIMQMRQLNSHPYNQPIAYHNYPIQQNGYISQSYPPPQAVRAYEPIYPVPQVQQMKPAQSIYSKQANQSKLQTSKPQIKKTDYIQRVNSIRKKLQKDYIQCRQCGQLFQTDLKHDQHMNQHFFQSLLKANEAQNKGITKKQSKLHLFDIKEWIAFDQTNLKQYSFQVLISQIDHFKIGQKQTCFFCNQDLQVSFSSTYEDWVFADSIKINLEDKVNVMHFSCYQCFKSDENSPVST